MNWGKLIATIMVVVVGRSLATADTFVKITQPEGKDGSGTGCSSGTLIGWTTDCSQGIFISCAHGYDQERPVEVEVEPGQTAEGRFLALDRDLELSLIAAPISRSTEMLRLADRSPRRCDAVRLVGYPGRKFVSTETRIVGEYWSRDACTSRWTLYYAEPCYACPEGYHELLVTGAASAAGLSGGAVVRNKRLAGVMIGRIANAKDAGLVVPGATVHTFVRRNITLFYRR
jgi:hypothetical protein